MGHVKRLFGIMGFIGMIVVSFYIISDIEKTPDWSHREAVTAEREGPVYTSPGPAVTFHPAPRPAMEEAAPAVEEMCEIGYAIYSGGYTMPGWLVMGLEAYIGGAGVTPLSNEDLALWLSQAEDGPPFGDGWLVGSLRPRGVTEECILDAAYTIVRRWSQGERLQTFVTLAKTDPAEFTGYFDAYVALMTGQPGQPGLHFRYLGSDFMVATCQGKYIFVYDNYAWAWPRVLDFVLYMDAATQFIREYFAIGNTCYILVTIYPFGVMEVPAAIREMADSFGWDAPDINFVANDQIVLASTARFGTWAMSHEAAHILLFREFPDYRPPTWLIEGMAVLGELLFREAFDGRAPYRFTVPRISNIDSLARRGNGHILPIAYGEDSFGRSSWTYDDVGSFMLYLYNKFGIEALLDMYRTDNDSQHDRAVEIFGKELEALMYSWRSSLWPVNEPEGWWCQ